jgi:hypothetical protein
VELLLALVRTLAVAHLNIFDHNGSNRARGDRPGAPDRRVVDTS